MQRNATQRSTKQLADLPTVQGALTRLAANHLRQSGIALKPLLARVGLTIEQVDDPEQWVSARSQTDLLEVAAEALHEDSLGLVLAQEFDCRDLGLWYYVLASSETLGQALQRGARYSRIGSEALVLDYREAREPVLRLSYSGIPRHADRHQMEFCIAAVVCMCRQLTGRRLVPKRVSLVHVRSGDTFAFTRYLGTAIEFGSEADEIVFPAGAAELALVNADPRLNRILLKVCEESLSARRSNVSPLRVLVENAITPLLPHGTARAEVVAKKLGMSERTLARRLAEQGLTYLEILQELRASLAVRYLEQETLPISRIAWLLGFEEPSSFSHACRRWTGKSPKELRAH
jgi:AraC-like DNA-binding protein